MTSPANIKHKKTLRILQWSHFVPSDDTWFDAFAKTWGDARGVQVIVDHINIGDLVTATTSEMSANSGHDIIELGPEAAQCTPNVLDMADINHLLYRSTGGRVDGSGAKFIVGAREGHDRYAQRHRLGWSRPNAKRPEPKFGPFLNLERETSLELATSTLARLRSTN